MVNASANVSPAAGCPVAQVMLAGAPMSCGRPSGYIDPLKAQQSAAAAAQALSAFQSGALRGAREHWHNNHFLQQRVRYQTQV